jgi:hypothetical protein
MRRLGGALNVSRAAPALNQVATEDKKSSSIPVPTTSVSGMLYVPEFKETWIRFVDGRPVSGITTRFLQWSCEMLQAAGKKVLLLIWDNARAGT